MSIYSEARKHAGLTQESTIGKMEELGIYGFSLVKLSRIENEHVKPTPEEVFAMARTYNAPDLYENYCKNVCEIGKQGYGLRYKSPKSIQSELVSSLTSLQEVSGNVYKILEDGKISGKEWNDLLEILDTLCRLSDNAKALKLWAAEQGLTSTAPEQKLYDNALPPYDAARRKVFSNYTHAAAKIHIKKSRLNSIENGTVIPRPNEIVTMATQYGAPQLYSYYCTYVCQFQEKLNILVAPLEQHSLDRISVRLLTALSCLDSTKEKLKEILADHQIDKDEGKQFSAVIESLDRLIYTADSLRLWVQSHLVNHVLADHVITEEERAILEKAMKRYAVSSRELRWYGINDGSDSSPQ